MAAWGRRCFVHHFGSIDEGGEHHNGRAMLVVVKCRNAQVLERFFHDKTVRREMSSG